MNNIDWGKRFDGIQHFIRQKDYRKAKILISETLLEAHRSFVDPTFLIRELQQQKKIVDLKLQKNK